MCPSDLAWVWLVKQTVLRLLIKLQDQVHKEPTVLKIADKEYTKPAKIAMIEMASLTAMAMEIRAIGDKAMWLIKI